MIFWIWATGQPVLVVSFLLARIELPFSVKQLRNPEGPRGKTGKDP
jgi:hypothetical protein